MSEQSQRVYLKDYTPPPFLIESVNLTFELDPESTIVTNEMHISRATTTTSAQPLILNGEAITFVSLSINGKVVPASDFLVDEKSLTIKSPPTSPFNVVVTSTCAPIKNTALEGLYVSGEMFCTQNEPHGFRCITYFLDRSDVMAKYTTTIIADKKKYPVMLSNGNLIESSDLGGGLHRVRWEDPFPKPSYLFALVAGDLGMIEGSFIRRSGKKVKLQIFTDKGNEPRCTYAMDCLKRAMKWDEDTFGLEYDLDIFMIVAVNDFNFGAMENKGLNIFSARAVLADMETATDERLVMVDAIVAHEYFHNWTGDRVTCRDWFQLTLKEGLTVLRDQLYTADVTNPDEKRIVDAAELERDQFPEDAGPLAHPIQPKSFVEINNFYTPTVYDKGAEVIRMMRTMIGVTAFRRGVDKYFELFDGKAVTTEDFVRAIEIESGEDFTEFRRWYHQSGTPEVTASMNYDGARKELALTLSQRHPNGKFFEADGTANAPKPVVIPVSVGLLTAEGQEMPVSVRVGSYSSQSTSTTAILKLSKESETFVFDKVPSPPVTSLLRGFSAPVRLVTDLTSRELATLLAHDTDPYVRWHAGQELLRETVQSLIRQIQKGEAPTVSEDLRIAFATLLKSKLSPGLLALTMEVPPESTFTDQQEISDFEATHLAHTFLRKNLATHCRSALIEHYRHAYAEGVDASYTAMGNRRLALQSLSYLMTLEEEEIFTICSKHQRNARNMTEEYGGMVLLADSASPYKNDALASFYTRWKNDPVVICSWFSAQALSSQPDTIERCRQIEKDPAFVLSNPSKAMSLYRTFANNQICFNASDGSGYQFISEVVIKLDAINPNMGAMVAKRFMRVKKLPAELKTHARMALINIAGVPALSKNTREVIEAALQSLC